MTGPFCYFIAAAAENEGLGLLLVPPAAHPAGVCCRFPHTRHSDTRLSAGYGQGVGASVSPLSCPREKRHGGRAALCSGATFFLQPPPLPTRSVPPASCPPGSTPGTKRPTSHWRATGQCPRRSAAPQLRGVKWLTQHKVISVGSPFCSGSVPRVLLEVLFRSALEFSRSLGCGGGFQVHVCSRGFAVGAGAPGAASACVPLQVVGEDAAPLLLLCCGSPAADAAAALGEGGRADPAHQQAVLLVPLLGWGVPALAAGMGEDGRG